MAERLRTSLSEAPFRCGEQELHLTVSIGVAVLDEGGAVSAMSLLAVADEALYRAKSAGRNRVSL